MSIWCTWEEVGYDDFTPKDWKNLDRGEVRSYAEGWSNHYPTADVERPACVNIAHTPRWCVPGHRDEDGDYGDSAPVGGWMRLDMVTWTGKYDDPQGPECFSVVMDEKAARTLAADLLAWADREKVHPVEETK